MRNLKTCKTIQLRFKMIWPFKYSSSMVFCVQNCSSLLWGKKKFWWSRRTFEIQSWRARICKSFSWSLEQFNSNCKKWLGFYKHAGNVRKIYNFQFFSITNGFTDVIGQGGYATVFKGVKYLLFFSSRSLKKGEKNIFVLLS